MVSVIITYRELDVYRKNGLLFQINYLNSIGIPDLEIIIVEQDNVENLNINIPNVKKIFIKLENRIFGKGYGLNVGFHHAKNDILFFTDCDVILPKSYYFETIKLLNDYDVVSPYKNVYYYNDIETQEIIKNYGGENVIHPRHYNMISYQVITAGFFGIRKNVFEEVKGFDEECFGHGHDDTILDLKLIKLNYKIFVNNNGFSYHLYHPTNYEKKYLDRLNLNKRIFETYRNSTPTEIKNKIENTKKYGIK